MRLVGIDFEFFNANEENMDVVACVLDIDGVCERYDITEDSQKLVNRLQDFKKDAILIAYAVTAEARSLLSLGVDPFDFEWVDLYVEFRMICNSNDDYNYGNYINSEGVIAYSYPFNPLVEDSKDHTETPKNLINCAYKLLGIKLDSKEKEEMRDLILSKDMKLIKDNMYSILEYCESDTKHLISIYKAMNKVLEREGFSDYEKDRLSRGRYAAAVAKSEALGLPIDMELLQKIIDKTPEILAVHMKSVNEYFPFFIPETQKPDKILKNGKVFSYKPKPAHKDMSSYQKYVESLEIPMFPKTETGKFKSDKDTLEEYGYWGGLEELWKYNKSESSLKWFRKDNKNGFFERVGSDKNVRPFYGLFGTQTGRNAAKAKTFPLAMSSYLRAIVRPKNGDYIIGCDFSQQEVYVAALLSGDNNMFEAYKSGDVYLSFAKQSNQVPEDATKASHKLERMLCKSTVLGLQFGMGHRKLKTKLRLDSGQEVSDEKTQELIDAHKTTYKQYWKWVWKISEEYKKRTPLLTPDGWALFCDNPILTSVRNFPVQGTAASITRLAVVKAWESGLKVLCSLHDAVYILTDDPNDYIILEEVMLWATEQILKEEKTFMRIDTKTISHADTWIEEKGEEDWNKIKQFLV